MSSFNLKKTEKRKTGHTHSHISYVRDFYSTCLYRLACINGEEDTK